MEFTLDTTLGEILDDPQAKGVLDVFSLLKITLVSQGPHMKTEKLLLEKIETFLNVTF